MMDTEREVSMASTICESTQQNKNNQVSLDCKASQARNAYDAEKEEEALMETKSPTQNNTSLF